MLRIGSFLIAFMIAMPSARAEAVRDCASNNHEVAIRACTQLINKNPRNAVYFYNRAISYRETGRADLALADYTRAIDLNARYFEAYNNRGSLYMARREERRAIQDFDRAIALNPGYALAHNNRGEAFENLNEFEQALASYNRAIDLNPRYARAWANRGDIMRKTGRRDEAIAAYRQSLTIDDDNRIALDGLRQLGAGANSSASNDGDNRPRERPSSLPPEQRPQQIARPTEPPPASGEARENAGSTGTGFFVSSQGHVLTNFHVIENCSNFVVGHSGAVSQSARVVARDQRNDLALLTTTGLAPQNVPPLRLGVRVGESIYIYGFPLSGLLASSGNFTTGNVTAVAGLADDTTMIQMSAPVQPGNSGGPVLDQNGNVVAIVVSKLNALRIAKVTNDIPQNVNFAIKSLVAMSFLEASNVNAAATAGPTRLETAELVERARGFTVQVRCH